MSLRERCFSRSPEPNVFPPSCSTYSETAALLCWAGPLKILLTLFTRPEVETTNTPAARKKPLPQSSQGRYYPRSPSQASAQAWLAAKLAFSGPVSRSVPKARSMLTCKQFSPLGRW